MAWTTPTFDFLRLRMGTDFDALKKQASGRAQDFTDIVEAVISDQVGKVRGLLPAGTVMGGAGSIPPETVADFVDLARAALAATIPGGALNSEDRQKLREDAMKSLRGIAYITPASDTATEQPEYVGGVSGSDSAPMNWGDTPVSN